MNGEKVKLRHAKTIDVKGIIELLTLLERPSPKDRHETKIFQKLTKGYIRSNFTKGNFGIILAIAGSKIIGLVSFALLERLNQPLKEFWIPELVVSKEYRSHGTDKLLIQNQSQRERNIIA